MHVLILYIALVPLVTEMLSNTQLGNSYLKILVSIVAVALLGYYLFS